MATETIQPAETDNHRHAPDGDGAELENARAWHEWLAVGVGVAGLLSIGRVGAMIAAPETGSIYESAANGAKAATLRYCHSGSSQAMHFASAPAVAVALVTRGSGKPNASPAMCRKGT